jgi:hypothetical protein
LPAQSGGCWLIGDVEIRSRAVSFSVPTAAAAWLSSAAAALFVAAIEFAYFLVGKRRRG